ncbi:hypothetical protein CVT26_012444 [Gymnopilus dilepis]|uniref:Uncharacterized protein n=1 Tax=Gymnopilus dilepis TaxID=231916 RepID=A0A409YW81_9AGAR|nr:hypothetical protein CVT26_012444 [Gymnopilus dilepis]
MAPSALPSNGRPLFKASLPHHLSVLWTHVLPVQDDASVKLSRRVKGHKLGKDNKVVEQDVYMAEGETVKIFPGSLVVNYPGDTSMANAASATEEDIEIKYRVYKTCADSWTEVVAEVVDPFQARVHHETIAIQKDGSPTKALYKSGQEVFYVDSSPLKFKSNRGGSTTVKKGDRLRLRSGAMTSTGGKGGANNNISTKNAHYNFEILKEQKHKYIWKSALEVNQRDLTRA